MHLMTDAVRRIRGGASGEVGRIRRLVRSRHRVPVLVGVVAVAGTVAGVLTATVGGGSAAGPSPVVPATRPAPGRSASPVVPLFGASAGTSAGTGDSSFAVPVARQSAGAGNGSSGPAKVAPLRGLRQADLLVVAPFSLSGQVQTAVSRLREVTSTVPIEAATIQVNGRYVAMLGVNPSTFRGYAARPTAASNSLWQDVAAGGVAVSYTMGELDRLSLGGDVTVAGGRREELPVVAFGTVGIGGVDAVVSDAVARSLGMPADNAIVVSAPPASVASLETRIKALLPRGAAVEPLVTEEAQPSGVGLAAGDGVATEFMSTPQLTAALQAAESRRGLPYVWGASGPTSFDCSGLVQWAFAQAGISMPRVAADQARTGPAVPVSELEPGDLLFYHTDPTAPGYISHVAIYLGNGWMIQAPEPGLDVEVVPASFGAQFAGAVRVDPRIAAEVAGGLA